MTAAWSVASAASTTSWRWRTSCRAGAVLLLRATRMHAGGIESNIRWDYGQITIPRHLRDIVVTEYGVADLRGKSDSECIEAMLSICDARFLDALCAEA